jgi:hypothetical protein
MEQESEKLGNEKLLDFTNIIRVIKSRKLRWVEHIARMGR